MDNGTITETLANMSVGAATALGIVNYVEQHTGLFSLLISSLGVIAAITFYWLNYRMRKKEFELKVRDLKKNSRSHYSSFGN